MNIVPLQSVPSQKLQTVLSDKVVSIAVYQRRYGLFINIDVNGTALIAAAICQNRNRLVRDSYLNKAANFSGDFMFIDTIGNSDPVYSGLGSQYQLVYLTDEEVAQLEAAQ